MAIPMDLPASSLSLYPEGADEAAAGAVLSASTSSTMSMLLPAAMVREHAATRNSISAAGGE